MATRILAIAVILVTTLACDRKSETRSGAKHYGLTGKITALDAKNQTATVDAAAIPNFMEAMTMAYPVASRADFQKLRVGESVRATVNVYESGDYNLSDIQEQSPASK